MDRSQIHSLPQDVQSNSVAYCGNESFSEKRQSILEQQEMAREPQLLGLWQETQDHGLHESFSRLHISPTLSSPNRLNYFPALGVRDLQPSPGFQGNFLEASRDQKPAETMDPLMDESRSRIQESLSVLVDDEEELFAGFVEDYEKKHMKSFSNSGNEELEEVDIFSSTGGLELERENLISEGSAPSKTGGNGGISEHPMGEHPSRTLFVRNINSNVEDSELRSLFEQYGEIRTLYTACKHRGFVMVSFYDLRAAKGALKALQNKPLRRRKLDIHFSIPKENPSEKDVNQGTLVVFNLDQSVGNDELRQIFGAYGEVKEIRETPQKKFHKFVEFYDVRAAESALKALNRSDIAGKKIKVEPSRPGGIRRSTTPLPTSEQDSEETKFTQAPLNVSQDTSKNFLASHDQDLRESFQPQPNFLPDFSSVAPFSSPRVSSSPSLSTMINQNEAGGIPLGLSRFGGNFGGSVGGNLNIGQLQSLGLGVREDLDQLESFENLNFGIDVNNIGLRAQGLGFEGSGKSRMGRAISSANLMGGREREMLFDHSAFPHSSSLGTRFPYPQDSSAYFPPGQDSPRLLPQSFPPPQHQPMNFSQGIPNSHLHQHSMNLALSRGHPLVSPNLVHGNLSLVHMAAAELGGSLGENVANYQGMGGSFNGSLGSLGGSLGSLGGSLGGSMGGLTGSMGDNFGGMTNMGGSLGGGLGGSLGGSLGGRVGTNLGGSFGGLGGNIGGMGNNMGGGVGGIGGSLGGNVGVLDVSLNPGMMSNFGFDGPLPSPGMRNRVPTSLTNVGSPRGDGGHYGGRGRGREALNVGGRGGNGGDSGKKHFMLDLEKIVRGEDKRTTLMIKNIPNKYTQKMLLAAIDDNHKGCYDFFYLPIDFKNKCNVGYAFINVVDPLKIIPLYQAFNGKKWEKFNSEKVAVLAYARIQGKSALVAHFQNSSLMNEDKRCRPILFHPNGEQEPFPVGMVVRPRITRERANGNNYNSHQGSPATSSGSREDSLHGGNFFGPGSDTSTGGGYM